MKRRVGIAVAGAVLVAGMVGGTGFAASSGSNGSNGANGTNTSTSVTSGDPTIAANALRCAQIQLQIVQVQLQIASAKNPRQARALTKKVVRLQQQFLQQCT